MYNGPQAFLLNPPVTGRPKTSESAFAGLQGSPEPPRLRRDSSQKQLCKPYKLKVLVKKCLPVSEGLDFRARFGRAWAARFGKF